MQYGEATALVGNSRADTTPALNGHDHDDYAAGSVADRCGPTPAQHKKKRVGQEQGSRRRRGRMSSAEGRTCSRAHREEGKKNEKESVGKWR